MTNPELATLIATAYAKWRDHAGWCRSPTCKDAHCQEVRDLFERIAAEIPGRDLPKPIKITVLPSPSGIAPAPAQVIHILTRYGNVLGRCLQGAPHTWPAHHWAVPWAAWPEANCETCLKGLKS